MSRKNRQIKRAKPVSDFNKPERVAPIILGKSMPRSGHHFLMSLLLVCLKKEFFYCEFYTNKECCKSQPCTNQFPGLLFIQKSHDFRLKDITAAQTPESCKFLIQYRHPVPRLFSDWNLAVKSIESLDDSYERFVKFAQVRQEYYVSFYKKWVTPFTKDKRFFMMSYESLVGEPFESIQCFLKFAINEDYQVSRQALEEANITVKTNVDIQSHKYYKPDFLQDYQMSIIKQLPECPYLPLIL
jgi:hypothetical protein